MNLIKKLSKYGNRTFDYAVVHGAEIGKDKVAELSIVRPGVSTGMQKLMQRYIIELLTPYNDLKFHTTGCDFVKDSLGAFSEDQVRNAFAFANASISNRIRAASSDLPADERLDSAELTDVSFIGDTISVSIALHNQAGSEYEIILPIYSI